jgi:hypothetical protein
MAEFVHNNVEVIKSEPSDNIGVRMDADTVVRNIDEIFEREDIKQLNVLLAKNIVIPPKAQE